MNAAVRARAADPHGSPAIEIVTAGGLKEMHHHLLDVAAELLLSQGYGATSIEAIASRARVSKRTLYHRFSGKAALMSAVVERLIDSLRPPADVPLIAGLGLPEILRNLAALILRRHHAPDPRLQHEQAAFAAQQFLQLVVSLPQLRALGLGQPMTADDIEAWIRQSVTLFLGGFRQLAEGTSTRPEGYIEA